MFVAVFTRGLRNAARFQLALPLYGVALALGLVQSWPVLLGLSSGMLANTNLQRVLTNGDAIIGMLNDEQVIATLGVWALLLPALSLLYSLAYNLFSGGILSVWNGTRSFWSGSWFFLLGFMLLGAILVVLGSILIGIAIGIGNLAGPIAAGGLAVLLLQLLNLVGEYARALAVVRGSRNTFAMFGAACVFCVRNLGALLFGLIGVILHLAALAVFLLVANALAGSPLVMLADQGLVLAWLWVKLLRLGWAHGYVQATEQPAEPAIPAGMGVSLG